MSALISYFSERLCLKKAKQKNAREMKGRIIVFSPHPDDEALGCEGTIAKRVREDHEVYIILTDGRHSHRPFSYPLPEELIVLRRKEALNLDKAGIKQDIIGFVDEMAIANAKFWKAC